MASTVFHVALILLGSGDSGTAFHAGGDVAVASIRVRLVSHERPANNSSADSGQAEPARESAGDRRGLKDSGAAASKQPAPSAEAETPPDYSNYFAKAYLTVNPEPLAAVEIRSPDIEGKRVVQLELSVFIDEQGKVRRVRPETPGVMEPYVEAATQAFEATPFKPGEISGRPVKSVIKVVVEFQQL